MDIKSAFLNSKLDEDIYIKAPPGHDTPFPYFKLNKALYGLKQAPKSWYNTLKQWIIDQNFVTSSADPCLFINQSTQIFIFCYVDNLVIIGNSEDF